MKVVLISTSDISHGAGIAAYRLHCGLLLAGIDSRMLVTEKLSQDNTVMQVPPPPSSRSAACTRRLFHMAEHALNVAGLQNVVSVATPYLMCHPWIKSADLIHLHNIHWHSRHLSLLMLPHLSRIPMIWTLHDMWPMTGHCYYPSDCTRWINGCGKCPDLGIYPRMLIDATAMMFAIKRIVLRNTSITVVAPSEWMQHQAQLSPIFAGKQVHCIPNGVDTNVFYQRDRLSIRTGLGIKPSESAILFVSSQLDDPRKGFFQFSEALSGLRLPKERVVILTMGGGEIDSEQLSGFRVLSMGYVGDEDRMAQIYSAADLQVVSSLQDNLPNVVLESLACGTPVVCFDCGGLKDMICHRENGYLAAWKDADDLRAGIEFAINRPAGDTSLREHAVATVKTSFELEKAASVYTGLYGGLIRSHKGWVE